MVQAVVGNLTDIGLARRENQDFFGDFQPDPAAADLGRLILVADGVGGHQAGRLASRLAVDVIAEVYYHPPPGVAGREDQGPDVDARLREAFREANRRLYRKSLEDPSLAGMASTCTALVLHRGRAHGAHVGDTRAYLLRDRHLRQLTRDHTAAQERVDRGLPASDGSPDAPQRNLVTRCLGFEPRMEPDVLPPLALARGDRLLVCSDGLHALVAGEEIAALLETDDPIEACERLVAAANARGGADNITVQVLRIDDAEEGDP